MDKTKNKKRTKLFQLLLTEPEWAELEKVATNSHVSASAYARLKIFKKKGE